MMTRRMAVLTALVTLLLASCTVRTEAVDSRPGSHAQACLVPRTILLGPSAFETALELWSREPVGSPRALSALEAACQRAPDHAARGTEHAACSVLGLMHASGEGVARNPHLGFRYLSQGARCGMSFDAMDLSQAEGHAIGGQSIACCGGVGCEAGCAEECALATAAVKEAIVTPLERACAAGRGVGCFMLSQLAAGAEGEGGEFLQRLGYISTTPKIARGVLLERACAAGVGPACRLLAYSTQEGDSAGRDRQLQRACDAGWGDACLTLGLNLDAVGSRGKAIPYWEKACRLGLIQVCGEVASILSKGEGVPKDAARAVALEAETWRIH